MQSACSIVLTENLVWPITASAGPHVICYTASLHLVDFKCASSFGEAQLLFVLSCATNCATHDPQLLTTTTFWHTQAARPFQHPAHEFQDLFERFLRMDAARSFDNI